MFGIHARDGAVWAEVVKIVEARKLQAIAWNPQIPTNVDSGTLQELIKKQVKEGSIICSDTWKAYTGIATQGYVHRLVEHNKGEYSDKKGTHINGLEGFWGYMKRKLAAKCGIRKEKLPLHLAEHVWKYNHRKQNTNQQVKKLLKQLTKGG